MTKAIANPTKSFFVRMITRDISLEDCILDLIDNSVDGAWHSEGSRPIGLADKTDLSKYEIHICATGTLFSIKDNCGGMTLDNAIHNAFSFGRNSDRDHDNYSIGIYGIGMKRAIFKLGIDTTIRSTFTDKDGNRTAFQVPINVTKWLEGDTPPWDFDIEEAPLLDDDGVEIMVRDLTASTKSAFDNPAFLQNLRRVIARDYSLHLNQGLKIFLNEIQVIGWKIELRQSDEFKPMRITYDDEVAGDKISIEIIGGMAAPPPDNSDPSDEDEGDKRFGWYVICNGRIVLAADKTTTTGWGTEDWPQWHRQYSGFIGIALFTAENAASLPLTTTKRSIDGSSEIFRRSRPKMREVTRAWINYTNQRKFAQEEAKQKESKAVSVAIYDVPKQAAVELPSFAIKKPTERTANINYAVPLSRLKKLATELGSINMPFREVGQKSFEYTYNDLVGED